MAQEALEGFEDFPGAMLEEELLPVVGLEPDSVSAEQHLDVGGILGHPGIRAVPDGMEFEGDQVLEGRHGDPHRTDLHLHAGGLDAVEGVIGNQHQVEIIGVVGGAELGEVVGLGMASESGLGGALDPFHAIGFPCKEIDIEGHADVTMDGDGVTADEEEGECGRVLGELDEGREGHGPDGVVGLRPGEPGRVGSAGRRGRCGCR